MKNYFFLLIVIPCAYTCVYANNSAQEQLSTPILFIIFNRPDTQQKVFEEIKKAQPKELFIAADGPRPRVEKDKERCYQARKIVEQVDWPCTVKTLFREKNSGGSGIAVPAAISWFFENVEEGIILEDDCLPSPSFFGFCQQLLERYRDDTRIFEIIGFKQVWNKGQRTFDKQNSYFFSRPHRFDRWGWATWKRAWKHYDFTLSLLPLFDKKNGYRFLYHDPATHKAIKRKWHYVHHPSQQKANFDIIWDTRFAFAVACNNGLSIFPTANLIEGIGFGPDATHTKTRFEERGHYQTIEPYDHTKMVHPPMMIPES